MYFACGLDINLEGLEGRLLQVKLCLPPFPPAKYVEVLPSNTSEYNLIWK